MNWNRRQALALLGSTALSACSTPAVVTRANNDPFEGGIGGTGIIGPLDGFGSLLINGLTVDLDTSTSIRTPFGSVSRDALAPGQVLTVAAQRNDGGTKALDVSIDYALVGVLHRNGDQASVNGIPLVGWRDALGHGAVNQRVAVSGTWTITGIRPSRIDPAPHGPDLIAGTFDGTGIGGTPLESVDPVPVTGTHVVVLGRAGRDRFTVASQHSGRFAALPRLDLLSVDGYLEPSDTAPGFRIAGLGHSFAEDAQLARIGGRRAIYFGPYNGLFDARRGYFVPDRFNARQQALRDGLETDNASQFARI